MLVVLTTDAVADSATLDAGLRRATRRTFDRLDSDGCMSTNDTVLLLASGSSGMQPTADELAAAVTEVCQSLARQLINDCGGASKVIEIVVRGAVTESDALDVARAVSRSNLLKCAIHGQDPNWGRILSALGTTDAVFDADGVDVAINGIWVCTDSTVGADRSSVDMSGRDVTITIDLHAGSEHVTLLTTDLTAEYVYENSAYAT
jgi:glutamate N-acetyltransferase/amino-acid N-acetyltransferase